MKPATLLLGLLGTIAFAAQANAQVLYGTTAAGVAGELYILNPTNGSVVQDVGPLNDAGAVNYPVTGLAYNPTTGILYGSTGNNPPATAAQLVTINPSTAQVTVIGGFNVGGATMADLAFDSNTGTLYGIGSVGGPQLYTINLATGQATVVGDTGLTSTLGGGLALNASSAAYGTPTASRFGTYNLATGAYTDIANPNKPVGGGYGSLDFNSAGTLFGLNVGSAVAGVVPTHLVTIDPANGAVTDLGASVNSLDAIVFVPEPPSLMLLMGPVSVGLVKCLRRRTLRQ